MRRGRRRHAGCSWSPRCSDSSRPPRPTVSRLSTQSARRRHRARVAAHPQSDTLVCAGGAGRPDLPGGRLLRLDGERWLRDRDSRGAAIAFSIIHVAAMLAPGCCSGPTCARCRRPGGSRMRRITLRNLDWSLDDLRRRRRPELRARLLSRVTGARRSRRPISKAA